MASNTRMMEGSCKLGGLDEELGTMSRRPPYKNGDEKTGQYVASQNICIISESNISSPLFVSSHHPLGEIWTSGAFREGSISFIHMPVKHARVVANAIRSKKSSFVLLDAAMFCLTVMAWSEGVRGVE